MSNRFERVIEWLSESDPVVDKQDVAHELRAAWDPDGFEFCKNLENRNWLCDASLVEILDGSKKSEFNFPANNPITQTGE